jgi:hypothetical protein
VDDLLVRRVDGGQHPAELRPHGIAFP